MLTLQDNQSPAAAVPLSTRKRFKDATPAPDVPPALLSARQLRKVRLHQEGFAAKLAARLSHFLRSEVVVKLAGVDFLSYQRMAGRWPDPAHLTLFKAEPLRGVCLLQIPNRLGVCAVDRLMGGPGRAEDADREMSAIESALLEQVSQIVAGEWCANTVEIKDLKASPLGCETSPRFLQTSPPQTPMLVITLDTRLGGCEEQIQLGFPFAALEPFIQKLAPETAPENDPAPAASASGPGRWNPGFDEVCIAVDAQWQGMRVPARDVLNLKVGDVLRINPETTQRVAVRLGGNTKFHGRLGAVAGKWAVSLTEAARR